jgi:hypothetical protein
MTKRFLENGARAVVIYLTKYTYLVFLVAATFIFLANLGSIPPTVHFQEFYQSRLLKLALYAGLIFVTWLWLRKTSDKFYCSWIAALIHIVGLALLFRVEGLGDEYYWRHWASVDNSLQASEILSLFVYRIAFLTGFPFELIAPISGTLFLSIFLNAGKSFAKTFHGGKKDIRPAIYLFYAASPISFLFLPGYVENTFISLPALAMALIHLLEFTSSSGKNSSLYNAALWFSVAGYIHGLSIALLPLIPIACILRFRFEPGFSLFFRRVSICGAIGLAFVVLASLSLKILGFQIVHLNIGSDGSYLELAMFTRAHALSVVNILFLTMPTFPVWWLFFHRSIWPRLQPCLEPYVLVIAGVVGFYCFAAVYGFDMGFPAEMDIMISLGILVPFLYATLYAGLGNWKKGIYSIYLFTLVNGLATWWTLTPIFRAGVLFKLLHRGI